MAKKGKSRGRKRSINRRKIYIFFFLVIFFLFIFPEIHNYVKNSSKGENTNTEVVVNEVKPEKNSNSKPQKQENSNKSTHTPKSGRKNSNYSLKGVEKPIVSNANTFYYNKEGRYYVQYDEKHKIPLYVSYLLTRKEASKNLAERSHTFKDDKYLASLGYDLADNKDYTRSGYDRGHMLPSADRNDSRAENDATFLFSNITPQRPALNRETLSSLERDIRELALKYDSVFIVTGSILRDNPNRPITKIGKGVAVPQYIYKVVSYKDNGECKCIGFLMPNNESNDSNYIRYATTVDKIEKICGIDLFHNLPDDIENRCESSFDTKSFNRK